MERQISQRFFDVKGVSQYLDFKEGTIRKWARKGMIPSLKINGALRFDKLKIDEWANSKERPCLA